jgi:SAM-dependent methyltransferase
MANSLYDRIGIGYTAKRAPDPSVAQAIRNGLGNAGSTLNVGAGTGSYEPNDRFVVAIETSAVMIAQRPDDSAPVVQALASALPIQTSSFDASLAVLTIHHWNDRRTGLQELKRVSGDRVVVLTWDPGFAGFWLTDYFPEILEIDRSIFPTIAELEEILGTVVVNEVPISHDCQDGFLGAYWRRPQIYLDPEVRSCMSTFSKISGVEHGVDKLLCDLADGAWKERYGQLLVEDTMDLGYRLVVAAA